MENINDFTGKKSGKNKRDYHRQYKFESSSSRRGAKRGQQTKGKSKAGITTKFHLAISRSGLILHGFLTGGEVHDSKVSEELVKYLTGSYVLADLGYDTNKFRELLEIHGNSAIMRSSKKRKVQIPYDKTMYKQRGYIERIFGKLKENRRLSVRFEKSDLNLLNMILLGFIKLYLC